MDIHGFAVPRPIWAVVAGVLLLAAPRAALAQGTEHERRACTPDVMRLCREFIPSVASITQCLINRRAELAPACHQVMAPPTTRQAKRRPSPPMHRRAAARHTTAAPTAKARAGTVARPTQTIKAWGARVSADPAIQPATVKPRRPATTTRMIKPAARKAAAPIAASAVRTTPP